MTTNRCRDAFPIDLDNDSYGRHGTKIGVSSAFKDDWQFVRRLIAVSGFALNVEEVCRESDIRR
jgi:hypothetical protein